MVPSVTGKKIAHNLPEVERRDPPLQKGKGKSRRFRRGESDGKGRGSSNYPIVEVYNDGSKTHTSHMKVPPGICGFGLWCCQESVWSKQPVAQMAQTCAREGKRVGDERDTEPIDESYHFRGTGNQIVSSFMKLRGLGRLMEKR